MKRKLNYMHILLFFITLPFLTISCNDDVEEQPIVFTPSITELSPDNGIENTEITIIGENFGSNNLKSATWYPCRLDCGI